MLHDFNHSQGLHPDKENVAVSIREWVRIASPLESTEFINKVSSIISYTEYPYDPDTVGVEYNPDIHDTDTYLKMILRDADLSQICTDNFLQQNVLGLSKELNIPLRQFLLGQWQFVKDLKWHTPQAKKLYDKYMQNNIMSELKFIIQLTDVEYQDLIKLSKRS